MEKLPDCKRDSTAASIEARPVQWPRNKLVSSFHAISTATSTPEATSPSCPVQYISEKVYCLIKETLRLLVIIPLLLSLIYTYFPSSIHRHYSLVPLLDFPSSGFTFEWTWNVVASRSCSVFVSECVKCVWTKSIEVKNNFIIISGTEDALSQIIWGKENNILVSFTINFAS